MPVISFYYYACHVTAEHYGLLQRVLWQKCKSAQIFQSKDLSIGTFALMPFTMDHVQLCSDKKCLSHDSAAI